MLKSASLMYLVILILGYSCLSQATEYGPRDFSNVEKWTAIVSAFEPELKAINQIFETIPEAKINKTVSFKGVKYLIGHYKGNPIIIFTTGISVPNATMTMQMALDYFPIDSVIMMGIAGAINTKFEPGDIAIPERWYFHDESIYANPVNMGSVESDPSLSKTNQYILPRFYEQALPIYKERSKTDPFAPKYSNFGYLFPRETTVIKNGWMSPQSKPYFNVSVSLLNHAKNAIRKISPIKLPSGKQIQIEVGGNGVTGSVFADNAAYRLWLQQVYKAQVTDMESAAVGQVCFVNEVDWLVIRSVSDLAGGQKGVNQESVFDALASGTGAKLLAAVLDEISAAKP